MLALFREQVSRYLRLKLWQYRDVLDAPHESWQLQIDLPGTTSLTFKWLKPLSSSQSDDPTYQPGLSVICKRLRQFANARFGAETKKLAEHLSEIAEQLDRMQEKCSGDQTAAASLQITSAS
jgi:hypothetical protein